MVEFSLYLFASFRSFARREFDKISLVDSQSEDVYDDAMEGVEEDNAKNDEIEALSPAKKQKTTKGGKVENKKLHKASLKVIVISSFEGCYI